MFWGEGIGKRVLGTAEKCCARRFLSLTCFGFIFVIFVLFTFFGMCLCYLFVIVLYCILFMGFIYFFYLVMLLCLIW